MVGHLYYLSVCAPWASFFLVVLGASSLASCSGRGSSGVTPPPTQPSAPDCGVSVQPSSVFVAEGSSATFTVSMSGSNGFNSQVSVNITGLPGGVRATPLQFNVNPGALQTVTVEATTKAQVGKPDLSVTASFGSLTRGSQVSLRVTSLLAALICAATIPPACGQQAAAVKPDAETLPLVQTAARNMVVITVSINGHDALVQLDTGAASTYLDLKALKMVVPFRRSVTVTGVFGNKRLFVFTGEIKVAGVTAQSTMIDADFHVLRETCQCALMGVVGIDTMKQFESVNLDLVNRSVTFVRKKT